MSLVWNLVPLKNLKSTLPLLMDAFPDIEMETMALQKCSLFECPPNIKGAYKS